MLKNTSWLAPVIVIAFAMLSGCASTANFDHTPEDASEFTKDFSGLKQAYPDIEAYDRIFAGPNSCPQESELEKKWGKPIAKKKWGDYLAVIGLDVASVAAGYITSPLAAIVFLLYPIPRDEYVWEKGNYEITALGRNDLLVGYDKRIFRWEWKQKSNSDTIAYNARQEQ